MRYLLTLLLAFVALTAQAAVPGYAIQATQADATGTSGGSYWVAPLTSQDGLYFLENSSHTMKFLALGTNLSITTGTLNAAGASTPTSSSPSRSLNTPWLVSSNLLSGVYAVKITTTATIGGGQEGEVFLEQADDSGFTTNVVTLDVASNSQTFTLAIALQGVQGITFSLESGYVPSGKYLRLRTNNVTGTPSYTLRNVRESAY